VAGTCKCGNTPPGPITYFGICYLAEDLLASQEGLCCMSLIWGRDSVVSVAIRYGLDGTGIKIFRIHPDLLWFPHSLPYNGYRVSFPGVRRPGRGIGHPPLSSAVVKQRLELYIYSHSVPSCHVIR
jgi:hypothetical protein